MVCFRFRDICGKSGRDGTCVYYFQEGYARIIGKFIALFQSGLLQMLGEAHEFLKWGVLNHMTKQQVGLSRHTHILHIPTPPLQRRRTRLLESKPEIGDYLARLKWAYLSPVEC